MLGRGWEEPNVVQTDDSNQPSSGIYNSDEFGIVPRSVADVFTCINAQREKSGESFNSLISRCQNIFRVGTKAAV